MKGTLINIEYAFPYALRNKVRLAAMQYNVSSDDATERSGFLA